MNSTNNEPRCGTCGELITENNGYWYHDNGDERKNPDDPYWDLYADPPGPVQGVPRCKLMKAGVSDSPPRPGTSAPGHAAEGVQVASPSPGDAELIERLDLKNAGLRRELEISQLETKCAEDGWPETHRLIAENERLREALKNAGFILASVKRDYDIGWWKVTRAIEECEALTALSPQPKEPK